MAARCVNDMGMSIMLFGVVDCLGLDFDMGLIPNEFTSKSSPVRALLLGWYKHINEVFSWVCVGCSS